MRDTDHTGQIVIQGVHVELTAAMQNAIHDKFSVLFRHNERIIRINVTLHRDQVRGTKHLFTATGRVEISGPDIVASVKADDAYAALDGLVEKLDEQLRDRRERRTNRRRENRPDFDIPLTRPEGQADQLQGG